MKSLAVAMALCTLISSVSAADQTCKAKAIKQKLAGEALLNFVKQCETDAMVACANKTAGKPDSRHPHGRVCGECAWSGA